MGKSPEMPLLLVDDRDGRVVAELENQEEVLDVLEALTSDESDAPDHLCIVELHDRQGALLATRSSVTIRPLSRPSG
jgi:hypothetical protein